MPESMSFFGIGLHVLVAIFFAIHAFRTGQNMFWLFILLAFPLLGSIIYFILVYLPSLRIENGAKKVASIATKVLDPTRELREAKAAFDFTPTAQNRMRLAAAFLKMGQADEAASHYVACLKGPFAEDPEIHYGAARSLVECRRYDEAIGHLESVRSLNPNYRADQVELLLARALAGTGRNEEAKATFAAALEQFNTFDIRAEYAIWAIQSGEEATAYRLRTEIEETKKRWNRHSRELNADMMKKLNLAFENTKKRA